MSNYKSVQVLIDEALAKEEPVFQIVLAGQVQEQALSKEELIAKMTETYGVMEAAMHNGLNSQTKSSSGISGGAAYTLNQAHKAGKTIGGDVLDKLLMRALAVSEVNACMGKIVAAPTAGSCGIVPAVLSTIKEEQEISQEQLVLSMFTAAGLGIVIANRATVSGAEGGCQAECGSAAAMAAGAVVEMVGGTPRMVGHACAMALKNVLGLVCDPVAGLVEIPCIKRNAIGAANALVAANLALAGVESVIPVDEVIDAMRSVGNSMASALKETAEGGLAATPTAQALASKIYAMQE